MQNTLKEKIQEVPESCPKLNVIAGTKNFFSRVGPKIIQILFISIVNGWKIYQSMKEIFSSVIAPNIFLYHSKIDQNLQITCLGTFFELPYIFFQITIANNQIWASAIQLHVSATTLDNKIFALWCKTILEFQHALLLFLTLNTKNHIIQLKKTTCVQF